MSLSDADIIKAVLNGERERFAELVQRYQKVIFPLCYRMVSNREEAEDLFQETFLAAFKGLARFQFKSSFATWLRRIALHLCFRSLRCRARRHEYQIALVNGNKPMGLCAATHGKNNTISQLQNQEMLEKVGQMVKTLPPKQRAVFVLRVYEGYLLKEIAEMLRCSEGTVKSQLCKARLKIIEALSPASTRNRRQKKL